MLILHKIEEMNYTVYIGSSGNKYIFNIGESNKPKPSGGYPDLKYICRAKGVEFFKHVQTIIFKAERIMGKTLKENLEVSN